MASKMGFYVDRSSVLCVIPSNKVVEGAKQAPFLDCLARLKTSASPDA